MKISSRCDYACRALAELAINYARKEPTQIARIAKNQDIPEKYLVHILNQLRRAGLVASKRGKVGGYSLAKKPSEMSLGQVMRVIDGPLLTTLCVDEATRQKCSRAGTCPFRDVWEEVDKAMTGVLDNITLEDVVRKMRTCKERAMYHI